MSPASPGQPRGVPEDELDGLYQGPLGEFVARRHALAKKLRDGGDREAAAWVSGLVKPVLSAAIVNQLYRARRREFEELQAAGEAMRDAQRQGAGAADQRAASERRRRAIQTLLTGAEALLVEQGHGTGASTLQRVGRTLEALAVGSEATPGRLVQDLEPPGFEALLGFTLAAPAGPVRVRDMASQRSGPAAAAMTKDRSPTRQELDRARKAVASYRSSLAKARSESERVLGEKAEAERSATVAERACERARDKLAELDAALVTVRDAVAVAAKDHRRAELRLLTAEKELEAASRELVRLEGVTPAS